MTHLMLKDKVNWHGLDQPKCKVRPHVVHKGSRMCMLKYLIVDPSRKRGP
jgi:hypothetical protein